MEIQVDYEDRPSARCPASPAYSVLVALQRSSLPLRHDCGGKALCGTCRVSVESGKGSPVSEKERARLDVINASPDTRLACQMRPAGDIRIKPLLPLNGTRHEKE